MRGDTKMLKEEVINYLKSLDENELRDVLEEINKTFNNVLFDMYTSITPGYWDITPVQTYGIILTSVGNNRIKVMKLIRELTRLGLSDVKNIIDNIPTTIINLYDEDMAIEIQKQFSEIGAKVELFERI